MWLSNIILVKKANNQWQVYVDFINLNKTYPKDYFSLSIIVQLVDTIASHQLLSFIDAYSSYNQIKIYQSNQKHTSFITNHDLYCYMMMHTIYQRLIN